MKTSLRTILIALMLISLVESKLVAQGNLMLHNFHRVPQTVYTNPSIIPDDDVVIGLPVISHFSNDVFNNVFTYNELFVSRPEDDSLELNMDGIVPRLTAENTLSETNDIDLLLVGIKSNNSFFSFGIRNRASLSINYPRSLVELLWNGNEQFLNKTLDVTRFNVNLFHYLEYHLGIGYKANDNVSLGVRLKFLQGLSNIYMEQMGLSLTTVTDPNSVYRILAETDIRINTAGLDYFNFGANSSFSLSDYMLSFNNLGFAGDIGISAKLSEQFVFNMSVLDIGFISWKSNVTTYESKKQNIDFDGVSIKAEQGIGLVDAFLDSLRMEFDFSESEKEYRSNLPVRIFVGGDYLINEYSGAGFLLQARAYNNYYEPSLNVYYRRHLTENFEVKVGWSMINATYDNIGLGFAWDIAPFQIYAMSDNLLGIVQPYETKHHAFVFGVNIMIGDRYYKEKSQQQPRTTKKKQKYSDTQNVSDMSEKDKRKFKKERREAKKRARYYEKVRLEPQKLRYWEEKKKRLP